MSDQKSLWEPEPDIFTEYEGTITEASFKFNEYGGQFSLTFSEIDGRAEDKPTWENYKLPPGWESLDGGETIQRVAGDKKGFVKSSQMSKLLQSVQGLGQEAMDALGPDAPVNANAWIGTRWRMEITELGKGGDSYKFKNADGEEIKGKTKDKNYPVAFLGKDSTASTGSSGSNGSNGRVDSLSVLTSLNDPVAESQIQELAKSLDYNAWFKQAYGIASGAGATSGSHPDLIAALGTRELYESLGGKG